MAASPDDSLDTLIVKATNPLVDSPDPVVVASFCAKVNHEFDGPQIASRLLAYRIHSPQEKEALHALALLEQCIKSCGPTFHSEIGKFRFLNELIKLVSPRYQAHRTPNAVKIRILDIIYTWTIDLKSEPKILEAYDMLKKQGVVRDNPTYLGTSGSLAEPAPTTPVTPRPKNPIFDDSEKQALLQKLLQSKNQEDLQAANRLIKSMVREEERRQEMANRRHLEIETVNSNLRLLEELLDNFEANGATAEEMDLCKELAANCDRLRPNLSRLAAEMDDKEDGLDDILRASDELSRVLERYEALSRTVRTPEAVARSRSAGLDLLDLGTTSVATQQATTSSHSVLDEQLLSLGLDDPMPVSSTPASLLQPTKPSQNFNGTGSPMSSVKPPQVKPADEAPSRPRGLEELDVLGEALLKQSLPANTRPVTSFQKPAERVPMNVLAQQKAVSPAVQATAVRPAEITECAAPVKSPLYPMDFDLLAGSSPLDGYGERQTPQAVGPVTSDGAKPVHDGDVSLLDTAASSSTESSIVGNDDVQMLHSPVGATAPTPKMAPPPLGDISLALHDIKPSSQSPVTLLEQSGLKVTLHAGSAQVPKDVSVFVVSTTSSNSSPIANYTFQAIVPKGCRVKLQPPSDNKLPPFNPFLPPPAITQVMLISTAGLNLIDLKCVVSFDMDGETSTEMGSVPRLTLCHHSSN